MSSKEEAMSDRRLAQLAQDARLGWLSRRQVLAAGLRLGVASPVIAALMASAPDASAAPSRAAVPGRAQEGGGDTFTVVILGGTEDLDPHSTYSTIGSAICYLAYDMLIRYRGESTSEFEPMLAESWEANAENTSFTFKIKPNARFHDGTACDAEAVKASFTRFFELGLGPADNVLKRFIASPEAIEAVDAATVRFTTAQPEPLFLAAMASNYGPYVVSPTAVEQNKTDDDPWAHSWFLANAVGTGPYRLVENSLSERVVLEQFGEYHGGWAGDHFDQVVFRIVEENAVRRQLLEQGEADALTYDLTPEDVEALKAAPDFQVLTYPSTRVNWATMNAVRMKTANVRRGFSYAFPYDDVMNGVYKGLITRSGPIANTVIGYDPNVFLYQTDLDRAKQLILSGGFAEGDSFDFIVTAGDEIGKSIAQVFQANLQQIGFGLEISELDYGTVESIVYGDQPVEEKPMFVDWAWWPDFNDPWNQLKANFVESAIGSGGSNPGGWVNDRFEQLMNEAQRAEPTRLVEMMKEAQNILTEQDPPAIYYGQSLYYTILGKDIQGFVANPLYLSAYPIWSMSRVQA
jgi:peptide/nickel transport system substrate-binding protein